MGKTLTLDGSTLEGGGQLVRVALSLSAICSIPVRITNIRAGRATVPLSRRPSKSRRGESRRESRGTDGNGKLALNKAVSGGGLKESHVAALTWLARECNAEVEGGEPGSREVTFQPRSDQRVMRTKTRSDEGWTITLKNPGSVWLIWQAIFPYIVFSLLNGRDGTSDKAAFRIRLRGGTNVPKSPSSEYMQQVFLPLCERLGLPRVEVDVIRRGWTTGSAQIGEVEITVLRPEPPSTELEGASVETRESECESTGFRLRPFHLGSPRPFAIQSISMTIICGSPETHSLLHSGLTETLRSTLVSTDPSIPINLHPSSTSSSGDERRLYILLTARLAENRVLGRDYLSPGRRLNTDTERRKTVEEAVDRVVHDFRRECEKGGCVDEFAEDQLVVFQALAEGGSRVDGCAARGVRRGKGGKYEVEEAESGTLHTRTVRWVCREMLGTVFDGVGGCEGGGWRKEESVDGVVKGMESLDVEQEDDE